ncbi:FkbM family methyltransferase [Ruegeria arenilitoris]|uniref:FkbM family methyltransferase n=1 Tax=Ruegeria arenilitoris TaxID=1173585 RepID=UPI00147C3544|nr:FkbM family methyltransferase [Ruegeria arenilitoris]
MIERIGNWLREKRYKRHRLQTVRARHGLRLVTLGSDYGGWTFLEDESLQGCTIVSAGLGEDASFDVEFANRYSARVVIIDPTPRAVAHFGAMKKRFGQVGETGYVSGGSQPVEAYDLSTCSEDNLIMVDRALWCRNETLRFFLPKNPEHVSHSIVNFQNDYRQDTDHLMVQADTLQEVLDDHAIPIEEVQLLKLDIEGAEVEVLEQILADGLRPQQICVEYDELNRPGKKAFQRVDAADKALRAAGYVCVYGNGSTDYLYLHEKQP